MAARDSSALIPRFRKSPALYDLTVPFARYLW